MTESGAEVDPALRACRARHWRANVRVTVLLLVIWAVVGPGCSILFADVLNEFSLGGFPLGFWFAQQGSIVVFVLLILVYALVLNRLDRRHALEVERLRRRG